LKDSIVFLDLNISLLSIQQLIMNKEHLLTGCSCSFAESKQYDEWVLYISRFGRMVCYFNK
jgi:hypothetical protein